MSRTSNRRVALLAELEDRTLLTHTVTTPVPITAQVLAYAKSHLSQQVGDGQCATLAADAVASGGGVPFYQLGPTGSNSNYVWGKLVTTLTSSNGNVKAIVAGDIIQFSNVTTTETTKIVYSNGTTYTSESTQNLAHHTAIVSLVNNSSLPANNMDVLQSNVNGSLKDQVGVVWGGSTTYHITGSNYTETYTYTQNTGTMYVYQPYRNVTTTLPLNGRS